MTTTTSDGCQAAPCPAWAVWILPLAAFAVFSPALVSSFHFDDYFMLNDPLVASGSGWWEVFRLERTRPLTYLSFWLNYQLGGEQPFGYHLASLLLHALTATMTWVVFRSVVSRPVALLAAFIFALHPLQSEPVAYVFARATILSTLFCLLCWRDWIRGRNWRSVLWFGLAVLSKEDAVGFPVFLAAFDWLCRPDALRSWRRRLWPVLTMAGLAVLAGGRVVYAASTVSGSGFAFGLEGITPWSYCLTQGRVLWFYAGLLVWPQGLNVDHDFALSTGADPAALAAWLGVLLAAGFAAYAARRDQRWFWLLGALVLLAPSSSVAPLADLVAERRLYLPFVCVGLGLASIVARLPRPAVIVWLCLLAGLSFERSRVWRTEESLWRDAEAKSPAKTRPKLQLARAVGAKGPGYRDEQRRLLTRAKRLRPRNSEVLAELGVFYLQNGQPSLALAKFQSRLATSPRDVQALTNKGAALHLLGQSEEARLLFQRALDLDPCDFSARNNLLLSYREERRWREALSAARMPGSCRPHPKQLRALELARSEIERDLPARQHDDTMMR